jgi:hypothetical protein
MALLAQYFWHLPQRVQRDSLTFMVPMIERR